MFCVWCWGVAKRIVQVAMNTSSPKSFHFCLICQVYDLVPWVLIHEDITSQVSLHPYKERCINKSAGSSWFYTTQAFQPYPQRQFGIRCNLWVLLDCLWKKGIRSILDLPHCRLYIVRWVWISEKLAIFVALLEKHKHLLHRTAEFHKVDLLIFPRTVIQGAQGRESRTKLSRPILHRWTWLWMSTIWVWIRTQKGAITLLEMFCIPGLMKWPKFGKITFMKEPMFNNNYTSSLDDWR